MGGREGERRWGGGRRLGGGDGGGGGGGGSTRHFVFKTCCSRPHRPQPGQSHRRKVMFNGYYNSHLPIEGEREVQ